MAKQSFEAWLGKVDAALIRKSGLGYQDLADAAYHDWYDSGVTPSEAARMVLSEEGFPF